VQIRETALWVLGVNNYCFLLMETIYIVETYDYGVLPMWKCKHCNNNFQFNTISEKANHGRWCKKNPNRNIGNHLFARGSENKFGKKIDHNVVCAACDCKFVVTEREKLFPSKEKYFCSRKCANSVGGTAKAEKYGNHGNYRKTAFNLHGNACLICGFDKVIEVHHIDKNRKNNTKENLVPLCPNHHMMIHRSKFKEEVLKEIKIKLGGEM
jgi:hypothetical protein